ncbi:MAG: transposase, partial [Thaumarchaeota archaeon]|nr:transposase [Nitrososphaerota archaeon]
FNVQVVCDLARSVWRKHRTCVHVDGVTVKFNIPRNCKTFETKSFFFVELGLLPHKRTAIPIRSNRNLQRFRDLIGNGWTCKTFGLTPDLQLVAYLSKEGNEPTPRKNVLGVDVNSKCFAVSVVSPEGKVLGQTYLGKDIWQRRRKIFERKSILRSYSDRGSASAWRKLVIARTKEHNFVKNRIGEVVREITNLALKYDAEIAIENLRRFRSKGKRFNREVMRMPFRLFKTNLMSRCFDKRITLNTVDSWHTSKWCSRCGAVGKGHDSTNYSLFRCKECGFVANTDRKASLAIAVKSLLERSPNAYPVFQISSRRVPVSGLIRRPCEVGAPSDGVPVAPIDGKPIGFSHE